MLQVVFVSMVLAMSVMPAQASTCDGPPECCVQGVNHDGRHRVVSLGIVVMGLSNINERSGTWDGDFYLFEEWPPNTNFTPQTEIVNEIERHSTQFDITEIVEGKCHRSRRILSTLRTAYDLRRFPFDHQQLAIEISDDEYSTSELTYADHAYAVGFEDAARTTLSSWKIDSEPVFAHHLRAFAWEHGAPPYDNATIRFEVRRHVTFHLFKYFLPLLVIVALAFSVFWIDPDDLSAAATVGVTCLLAAIAFQFAEASTLPEVSYMTLADRVYIVCYVAIGGALLETVFSSQLARRGEKPRAVEFDRWCRAVFPSCTLVAIIASVIRAFTQAN